MFALTLRNIKLYFHNKAGVFFSLLGALLAFILYLIFLQKNMSGSWSQSPNAGELLHNWLMSGTVAVAGITTSWTVLVQLASDREKNRLDDFLLTDSSLFRINMGYLLAASFVALIMQAVVMSVMSLYFYNVDGLVPDWSRLPQLLLVMLLNALLHSSIGLLVMQFIQTLEVAERLSTIIGTTSGFLVGVYMPVGVFPNLAQTFIKLTPGAYASAAFRQILMAKSLDNLGLPVDELKEHLGVGLKFSRLTSLTDNLLIMLVVMLISLILLAVMIRIQRRQLADLNLRRK